MPLPLALAAGVAARSLGAAAIRSWPAIQQGAVKAYQFASPHVAEAASAVAKVAVNVAKDHPILATGAASYAASTVYDMLPSGIQDKISAITGAAMDKVKDTALDALGVKDKLNELNAAASQLLGSSDLGAQGKDIAKSLTESGRQMLNGPSLESRMEQLRSAGVEGVMKNLQGVGDEKSLGYLKMLVDNPGKLEITQMGFERHVSDKMLNSLVTNSEVVKAAEKMVADTYGIAPEKVAGKLTNDQLREIVSAAVAGDDFSMRDNRGDTRTVEGSVLQSSVLASVQKEIAGEFQKYIADDLAKAPEYLKDHPINAPGAPGNSSSNEASSGKEDPSASGPEAAPAGSKSREEEPTAPIPQGRGPRIQASLEDLGPATAGAVVMAAYAPDSREAEEGESSAKAEASEAMVMEA